ncbi:hypothetical protein DRN74_01750 [Candidatus Micrarchaeota archaeon]|nr:MAG: hypothetical protein DRN74_01750 [Candidatus Micrarchaeota archaeon]
MTVAEISLKLFALIFGYLYPDLLLLFGAKKKFAFSLISIALLAFVIFVAFLFAPFLAFGRMTALPIHEFYKHDMFWIAVFSVIGGGIRFIQNIVSEKFFNKK